MVKEAKKKAKAQARLARAERCSGLYYCAGLSLSLVSCAALSVYAPVDAATS